MSVISINSNNFSQEVLQSDKPVLVDFHMVRSMQMLSPIVDELAGEHLKLR